MTRRRRQGNRALSMLALLSLLWCVACARHAVEKSTPLTASPSALDSPSAMYQMGLIQLASGDYLQARLSLEQAVALAPDQASYRNALGLANLQLGRFPQAQDAFREALKQQRDFPDAYNNLGVALAQDGKWQEAVAVFEKALMFPSYNSPEIIYQNLGWAYYNLARYAEAETAFSAALRLDPKLPVTHYTLGLTWEKTGRVQEAREAYRQVLKLASQDSDTGRKAQERLRALGR